MNRAFSFARHALMGSAIAAGWLASAVALGGCQGQRGSSGLAGTTGPAGSQGSTGTAGSQGSTGTTGPQGSTGSTGPLGPSGADGSLRIYGNGSAGAKIVSSNEDWTTTPPTNLQFTTFTVNSGVTLTVPSGVIIRCTGTFTNNGTITVDPGASQGGTFSFTSAVPFFPPLFPPSPGVSRAPAGFGEIGDGSVTRAGGRSGGALLPELTARSLLRPGALGGGGGSGGSIGGSGGGSFTVLAQGALTNASLIEANGFLFFSFPGGGGGAGGFVILASKTSVTNSGTINAKGGEGGASNTKFGVGGGGGGGIVHLLAPTITTGGGTIDVSGGMAGTPGSAGSVSNTIRGGGGGGGACGGHGGSGGDVSTAGDPGAGISGNTGLSLQSLVDPTSLF